MQGYLSEKKMVSCRAVLICIVVQKKRKKRKQKEEKPINTKRETETETERKKKEKETTYNTLGGQMYSRTSPPHHTREQKWWGTGSTGAM
jgi:hypothetical protein